MFAVAVSPAPALAAAKAELWQKWTSHDPASKRQVDHRAWDRFLQRHVISAPDGVNRIDYGEIGAADQKALQAYIGRLTTTPVSTLTRNRQKAYWINLYNALTVGLIVDRYPVTSIRKINISPGFFSVGPWGRKLLTVEGEKISLDDIEHRILRPIWRDPRVHYALNCASVGCPDLGRRAYLAETLETRLDQAARGFVNDRRGVRLDGGKLYVSSIYEWFKEDFGGNDRGVIDHLRRYAGPDLAAALKNISRITDDDYDWSLNDIKN